VIDVRERGFGESHKVENTGERRRLCLDPERSEQNWIVRIAIVIEAGRLVTAEHRLHGGLTSPTTRTRGNIWKRGTYGCASSGRSLRCEINNDEKDPSCDTSECHTERTNHQGQRRVREREREREKEREREETFSASEDSSRERTGSTWRRSSDDAIDHLIVPPTTEGRS